MSTTNEQRLREALDALCDAVGHAESAAHDLAGPAQRKDARESYAEATRCITALAQQAPTPAVLTEPMEPLRTALAELVALRDLKTFAAVYPTGNETALRDYARRQLPAWEAARAALATHPTPSAASEPAAPVDARDASALPSEYLLAKLAMVIPLFQEARDALAALREDQRVRHGISKTLAARMDVAGTLTQDDWRKQFPERAAIARQAAAPAEGKL